MTPPAPLDRLILGDNQFFGINHRSQDRSFAYAKQFFTDQSILDFMLEARRRGVNAMMHSTHARSDSLCDAIRAEPEKWRGFGFYPLIPYAFKYVMALNEKSIPNVILDEVRKLGVKESLSMLLSGGLALGRGDALKLLGLLIDLELRTFRDLEIRAVVLHNVVVDLIIGLKLQGILKFYVEYIQSKGLRPAFGTLNLPLLLEAMKNDGISEDILIMCSVNKIGFLMSPSKEAYEPILRNPSLTIMAMSMFASGAIPAQEALDYAASFPAVKSFLFGASRPQTLDDTVKILNTPRVARNPA